jgi:hypothetical protein
MRPSAPEPLYRLTKMRLRKKQRLMLVVLALLLVGGATGLTLAALQDKVAFFVTPSDIAAGRASPGRAFRIGGLVAQGSIKREGDGAVRFALTDTAHEVNVTYKGILPTSSATSRAWSPRARWHPTAPSAPRRSWQARRDLHAEGGGGRAQAVRPGGRRPMIVELGHYAPILAFGLALVQAVLPQREAALAGGRP